MGVPIYHLHNRLDTYAKLLRLGFLGEAAAAKLAPLRGCRPGPDWIDAPDLIMPDDTTIVEVKTVDHPTLNLVVADRANVGHSHIYLLMEQLDLYHYACLGGALRADIINPERLRTDGKYNKRPAYFMHQRELKSPEELLKNLKQGP